MTKYRLILIALAMSLTLSASAQKKKAKHKKAATTIVESPGLKIYKSMIPSTAKLMFIDSVVVDKNDFLSAIPLNTEAGKISMHDSIFAQYQNEFGDRLFFASGDSTSSKMYSADRLGNRWDKPTQHFNDVEGINFVNYPFLMSDGVTLYFAAKGDKSMGGYDIFMSTFDYDNGSFYTPENIGLPYNSTANDYLLAIDEIDKLGWLVTDRRQPEGKVCIYTFVPTDTRQGFDDDDLTDEEIEKYSRILRISDTWKFGNRAEALKRLDDLKKRLAAKHVKAKADTRFVINDNTVYYSVDNFKSSKAKSLYIRFLEKKANLEEIKTKLDEARQQYHESSNKASLSYKIKTLEKSEESLTKEIKDLQKNIRYTELNNL